MIRRSRPDLEVDSDPYRGALLLLLVDAFGVNIDRLVRLTGMPREVVARGIRRLIDNGWASQSENGPRWCPVPPDCRNFWLDVEVLLGLSQCRIAEDGSPEWAPVGEWIKDFEYQGARAERTGLHNTYRKIALHDPEPVIEAGEHEEESEPVVPAPAPRQSDFTVIESGDRTKAAPDSGFLGVPEAGDLLDSDSEPSDTSRARPNDAGVLVGDWSGANWLS
jgi:hypothetical protein